MNCKKNLLICGNPNPLLRIMIENLSDKYNIYFITYSQKNQFSIIKKLLKNNVFVNKRQYLHNIIVWIFLCLTICKKQKIDIFIAYTDNPIPNGLCMLLLKWLNPHITRIFFPYDVVSYAVPKEFKYKHKSRIFYFFDRICYENANKIITKGAVNELKYLHGIYKIYNKPHFPFNFLIERKHLVIKDKKSIDKNNIQLVFIGGLSLKDDCITAFEKILKDNKISLHIYTHSSLEFFKNKISANNIIFHSFIKDHKQLMKEISQYDFGLSFSYSFKHEYLQSKMASGLRIYDYITAGLPVIVDDKHELMANLIKENNFGIVVPVDEAEHIGHYIGENDYSKLISCVKSNRKKYFVESNIDKLVAFLEE